MDSITFENIYVLGNVETENEQYRHYHYPEMLVRYDSNFIQFKMMPSVEKFKKTEKYLKDFHNRKGQKNLSFTFPENIKLPKELADYFTDKGYKVGFIELYAIKPKDFPVVRSNHNIEIKSVTEHTLHQFLEMQYNSDLVFGLEFAKQKTELLKRQFNSDCIEQVIAFYEGNPAGYVELIVSDETVEIDNLTVLESLQRKGIGSCLQQYVMDSFPNKTVILVADGEDTPKEMYKKQNYIYKGFKYEILKVCNR